MPAGAETPVSGPEALQAAMRALRREQAADVPAAETVETPAELDETGRGLDALARAAGGSRQPGQAGGTPPDRQPARVAAPKQGGREDTGRPQEPVPSNSSSDAKADVRRKQAMIVVGFAVVAVVLIAVIVVLVTREHTPPPEGPAAPTPGQTQRRRPFTGHQPGELFGEVPFEGEREESGEAEEDGS